MIRSLKFHNVSNAHFRQGTASFIFLLACLAGFCQSDTVTRYPQPRRANAITWVVPGALTGLGIYGALDHALADRPVRDWRNQHHPGFKTRADDVMPFLPMAAVYALDLFGIKGTHDFPDRTAILLKSEAMMLVLVYTLKSVTRVERPDGSNRQSFPSGHTAQAFLAANFLHHEYGRRNVWYSVAGYTVAASVGALRIVNNKHWVSDVLAGAGIGMLCSELAYHSHRYRLGKKVPWTASPYWGRGSAGIYASIRL